jgi:hypothetical protein
MSEAKPSRSPALYASSDDFRRVFHDEADSLYRLAFLLTADHEKAQQCFVYGLEDSVNGSAVLRTGHTRGHGGRSFKTPYEPSSHARWRNMPLRVSMVVAQSWQPSK